MNNKIILLVLTSILSACFPGDGGDIKKEVVILTEEDLGRELFHDTNLSKERNQSCATCHDPQHGFIDNRNNEAQPLGVSLGDDNFSIGVRNTPTAGYAKFSPNFSALPAGSPEDDNGFIGGQFLDGREDDLKGQAGGPPLNPVEMNMPDKASVIARIKENDNYIAAFQKFYGENVFDNIDSAYLNMTKAIANFEKTDVFSPFNSKWDRSLLDDTDERYYEISPFSLEGLGKAVFFSPANSSCVNCHMINDKLKINEPLQTFSNYKYFNIGVPENMALKNVIQSKGLHAGFLTNGDMGLFENPQVNDESLKGKFKTPTLRNIAVTGPYMHNGVFKELKTVLEFYDFRGASNGRESRKTNPETGADWAATSFPSTIDHGKLGQQKLSDTEIDGLECFLRLLTDKKFEDKLPPLRDGLNCD